jgi:adenine-specific DNA-methyltransferase
LKLSKMSNYNQLKDVLNDIFELNKADLDFGIYRIINQKRKQVNEFIEVQLPEDIKKALNETQSADKTEIENEIKTLKRNLDDAGILAEESPKYKTLKERLSGIENSDVLEQEVFSHLANFFRRYYKDGDFISMRRYKKDVYAIPYEGEEVKLHWANHDQYYIKSSENFKNYSFKTPDGKKVSFQLKEVSTEQNNNKAQGDVERKFAIYDELPVEEIEGKLFINFIYEPITKSITKDSLNLEAYKKIIECLPSAFDKVKQRYLNSKGEGRKRKEKIDGKEKEFDVDLLFYHIDSYVSKNSFDYFIHKDLGRFLSREMDFYIKNEVLYIDDINSKQTDFFVAQLSKVKAIKTVAGKVIDFLQQIENFQKKLWLKKKFVIRTDYCITIDKVPNIYYNEILQNKAQLQEWKSLFDVEIQNVEQLIFEQFLVLDTQFFDEVFKDRLLAEFDNLEGHTDGLLINSENYQALNLFQEKYQEKVDVTYIDPPYNTGSDGFVYKDGFSHSSWLTFMYDRLSLNKTLISNEGSLSVSINSNENLNLQKVQTDIFENFENSFTIKVRHEKRIIRQDIRYQDCIEYLNIASKSDFKPNRINLNEEEESPLSDYTYKIEIINNAPIIEQIGSFTVEIFGENDYKIIETDPNEDSLKRYTIRGSLITQKGSASEFYELNLRSRRTVDGNGALYKVIGMGTKGDGLGYRYVMQPTLKGGDNGIYFQGLPVKGNNENKGLPYPNFYDFVNEFNDCSDEGGIVFKNGKKPTRFLQQVFEIQNLSKDKLLLDYFGGSASSGHAAIKLNRIDGGKRRYILVEMGTYFNTVTKPRIQKVIYSDNWKNGKPQDKGGISQIVKYQVLESYEDTLNNLFLESKIELDFSGKAKEEYLLQYMLEMESRENLFNIEMFRKPFDYQLKVTENNELKLTKVDLVETFNYLIGLYVNKVQRVKDIKVVEGVTRNSVKTLVIWRDLETTTHDEVEKLLRRFYDSQRTKEFQQIYINGDHHLENLRSEGDSFKIKLIEETFFKKMFNETEL